MDYSSIFLERLGKTTEENSVRMAGLLANILNWDFLIISFSTGGMWQLSG
jgi:hypothetical protein